MDRGQVVGSPPLVPARAIVDVMPAAAAGFDRPAYERARGRAKRRLSALHPDEFRELLGVELAIERRRRLKELRLARSS